MGFGSGGFNPSRAEVDGSTKVGSDKDDHKHQMTGSVEITGSLKLNGSAIASGGSGNVVMDANASTDNVIVTTDGAGVKKVQQANAVISTGNQHLNIQGQLTSSGGAHITDRVHISGTFAGPMLTISNVQATQNNSFIECKQTDGDITVALGDNNGAGGEIRLFANGGDGGASNATLKLLAGSDSGDTSQIVFGAGGGANSARVKGYPAGDKNLELYSNNKVMITGSVVDISGQITGSKGLFIGTASAGDGVGMVGIGVSPTSTLGLNVDVAGAVLAAANFQREGDSSTKVEVCTNTAGVYGLRTSSPVKFYKWLTYYATSYIQDPSGDDIIQLKAATTDGDSSTTSAVFTGYLSASNGLHVSGGVTISDVASPTRGDVALQVHHTGTFNPTTLSTGQGGGEIVFFGTGSTSAGAVYFLNNDGGWSATNATGVGQASNANGGNASLLALAPGTSPGTHGMLTRGYINLGAGALHGSFVKGGTAYLHTDWGKISFTAPSAGGSFVRAVGYGTDTANVIYFDPDSSWTVN